jgi:inorganic phosphate transporter, PiT family
LVKPLLISPLAGFVASYIVMALLNRAYRNRAPSPVNQLFARLQIVSAALIGYSHGRNDAQKTMGIITLVLFTGTTSGAFAHLPGWLDFLKVQHFTGIPEWIVVVCALTMFGGTMVGGWRIIATMGHRIVKLTPVNGFVAETTSAVIIEAATLGGVPLSTTHVISASIMGVGATRRFSAVRWGIVGRIAWAWILTLPVTGFLAFGLARLFHLAGL